MRNVGPHNAILTGASATLKSFTLETTLPCIGLSIVVSLGIIPAVGMAAANKHVSEALEQAKEAVKHGKQGHADALANHAEAALKHVQVADKEIKGNTHIQESMKNLEDAVLQAKQGYADQGTRQLNKWSRTFPKLSNTQGLTFEVSLQ